MNDIDKSYSGKNIEQYWITQLVAMELQQDGAGEDLSAQLIPSDRQAKAIVITREEMVLCGRAFVEEVFSHLARQHSQSVAIDWDVEEGQSALPNQRLFQVTGNARLLLTGERSALNILQSLSGTATLSRRVQKWVDGTHTVILDTRKTLPAMRHAQKYAVRVGGCSNHRLGLSDAFLIKENHIISCGGIRQAIEQAKRLRQEGIWIEIEVETIMQFIEALACFPDRIMLDNFTPTMMAEAVRLNQSVPNERRALLEVSGVAFDEPTVRAIAALGVDYISLGPLTKHLRAIDLSMRIVEIS